MDKEQGKSFILILLIMLCIWQTGKLWLGNMSSLNFFEKSLETSLRQIEPASIWLNPGAPVAQIYRLGEENREYQSVSVEIEKNIRTYMKDAKVIATEDLDWDGILTKQGILYEYPMPLTYGEVTGSEDPSPPTGFPQGEEIDYVFMQLIEEKKEVMKWYLITLGEKKVYALEVQGHFENMQAFNDLLKEESLSSKVKYQPTYNMGGVSTKNLFLPLSSKEISVPYDVLEYSNPLEDYNPEEEFSRFNPYINHFFLNPLLKKEEKTEDGIYIFSELMRAVVKYYPSGVFEYSNIGIVTPKDKVSRLNAYTTAKNFLIKNESIPKDMKKKIFLVGAKPTDTGYIFYFDIKFGGIPIYLSQEVRDYFGMDHVIEITVQGSRVSNFKWNAWILKPKIDDGHHMIEHFTMKYTDALNKVLEYVAKQEDTQTLVIDDMKWVYMINAGGKDVHVRWIVLHNNKWYSP